MSTEDPGHRAVVGEVLLITGPAGSGKSTLGRYLAEQRDWAYVSEDDSWAAHGWSGLRSPEQQAVVEGEVLEHVLALGRQGRSVVLEFIVFAEPPNPLSRYESGLGDRGVATQVVVLKPSVAEILRRLVARGRPNDLEHLASRQTDAEHQVRVLESDAMRSYPTVDNTRLSVEETAASCGPAGRSAGDAH